MQSLAEPLKTFHRVESAARDEVIANIRKRKGIAAEIPPLDRFKDKL